MPSGPMTFGISGDVARTERLKTGASLSLEEILISARRVFRPTVPRPTGRNPRSQKFSHTPGLDII